MTSPAWIPCPPPAHALPADLADLRRIAAAIAECVAAWRAIATDDTLRPTRDPRFGSTHVQHAPQGRRYPSRAIASAASRWSALAA